MSITSINPYTGQTNAVFTEWAPDGTTHVLDTVHAAYRAWRTTPLSCRAEKLRAAARLLRDNADHCALLMAEEMGKPITQGQAEAIKCATVCEHYAETGPDMLAPHAHTSDASRSYVVHEPLGIVLAVMPWNFPFWQVFRIAAPVLLGGNAMVLKHASNVPKCALAIEEILRAAGLGEVFRTLMIGAGQVPEVLAHPGVIGVSLTGSGPAGAKVAAAAGAQLKKSLLELGGSDPFVVLADADVDLAVREGILSRFLNAGQTCIAAKRFIVEAPVYDEFLQRFVESASALPIGNPFLAETVVGPLAKPEYRDELTRQIHASVAAGATLMLGGAAVPGTAALFAPTVLADVQPGMPAFDEETFGPVAAVVRADNADHAIELANQTEFGLGASIWSRDESRAEVLARSIDAGCVFVNGMVKSDPRLPFGGIKASGFGRELAANGLYTFLNTKTVWVR